VGDVITVEKMPGKLKEGDAITFDKVLLWDNGKDTSIGTPYIPSAKVEGTLSAIGRAQKVLVVKYKQKSRYLVRRGHRQHQYKVTITKLA
jgi:large subunit ribosomal protein L21